MTNSPRPDEDNPRLSKVYKAVQLIRRALFHSDCANSPSNLHCELEDYNLSDDFFLKDEMEVYNSDAHKFQLNAENDCYMHLKNITTQERYMAIAILDFGDIDHWKELIKEDQDD